MVFVSLSPARLPATGLPEVLAGAVVPQWPRLCWVAALPDPSFVGTISTLLVPHQP